MIRLTNKIDSFKTVLDRNGQKIHIGEQALIINYGCFLKCQVVGFSVNYKYVYLVSRERLYKRLPANIVLVHNLRNWKTVK
jgi:hypothetical protein